MNSVSSVLSAHCPSVFMSGVGELRQTGWWKLYPDALATNTDASCSESLSLKTIRGQKRVQSSSPDIYFDESLTVASNHAITAIAEGTKINKEPTLPDMSRREQYHISESIQMSKKLPHVSQESGLLSNVRVPCFPVINVDSLQLIKPHAERTLLCQLKTSSRVLKSLVSQKLKHKANRLVRKISVRQTKRARGIPVFNLDLQVAKEINRNSSKVGQCNHKCYTQVIMMQSHPILDRFLVSGVSGSFPVTFVHRLMGGGNLIAMQEFVSPYTGRLLKPFIWRDYECLPARLKLLNELQSVYWKRNGIVSYSDDKEPIDYCYVRPWHIPAVNSLCRQFFWPNIDLSECLQYPDFSVVVQYKKLVIACAFMTPDVKYDEAYISFLVVHPEWRRCGIATFMIYHLIQTCMGKDVTLHVSATNEAMVIYQKFGFKAEELNPDFYDNYFPAESRECRHAFFLRLRRS